MLPTGVVTFLLTDVVGSTALWEQATDAMVVALPRHDGLIAGAVERHGGVVLKSRGEGDSTFCVFQEATDAAAAALDAQRALLAESWPERIRLRVRMAMHTGEAIERDGDYFGQAVNRAARLRATAGGGDIIVSEACAQLVRERVPSGAELSLVGTQVLRDLTRPETIYALYDPVLGAPHPSPRPTEPRSSLPARLAMSSATFVGRSPERDLISRAATKAGRASRQVVLISGEPGVGKTRLASEVAAGLLADGWTVLYGRCDEDLDVPYQPFAEVLTDIVSRAPTDVLAAHIARHGGAVARLVPALARRMGSVPIAEAVEPETERLLLLDAVAGLISTETDAAPTLIVLDDLHWGESNTLLMLRHIVRAPGMGRLLILASYRSSDLATRRPVGDALAALAREEGVQRLPLAGLSADELLQLMEQAANHQLGSDGRALADLLWEETDGNPFFVNELLRHFAESGVIAQVDGYWTLRQELGNIRPPDTVQDVIAQRVGRLGPAGERALTMASVLGRDFDLALLADVLEASEDAVLDELERARDAWLVAELPGRVGRFTFAHALVAHSLYERIGLTRRSRAHRRVAEAIEAACGGDPAERLSELATHWLAAGPTAEPRRVLPYMWAAGDRALEQLAPDEAARWFGHALQLLQGGDAPAEAARCDLLISLGVAQMRSGDPAFRETLLRAAATARATGDSTRLVRAALANNRGDTSTAGVVDVQRVEVLEEALAAVGDSDDVSRARLLVTLAVELIYDPDWQRRVALSDEALAIARRAGDPAALAEVLNLRHEAIRLPHTLDARLIETAEQLELAERIGDPVLVGFAALRRGRAALEAADMAESDRCARLAAEVSHLHPYLRWDEVLRRSYRALLAGDTAAAEEATFEAFAIAQADDEPDAMAVMASQLVSIRWDQGRFEEVEGLLRQAVADNPGIPGFRAVLGVALCELDRLDEAHALFAPDAADGFEAFPYDTLWLSSMVLEAEVCSRLRHGQAAAVLAEKLRPYHAQVAFAGVAVFGLVATVLGQLAWVLGDFEAAAHSFAEGEALATGMGAVTLLARNQLGEARLLAYRGAPADAVRAEQLLKNVAAMAADRGLGGLARRVSELATAPRD